MLKNALLFAALLCTIAALVLWWSPELRRDAGKILRNSGIKTNSVTLYKWQDKNGVWQYTQALPPQGVPYEEVEARSDVNVLPLPEQLKEK